MWARLEEQCEAVRRADPELAPGELLASATARGAELEGITAVLLLTDEDDFNAPAAAGLAGAADGPVYRLGARLPAIASSHRIPAVRSCSARVHDNFVGD